MSNRNYLFCVCIVGIILLISTASASVPFAKFHGKPIIGHAPLIVTFKDLSTDSPTGWAWYFGDESYTEPWTQMTANAEWSPRAVFNSVTMPDGSIVLMGGYDGITYKNDVWRSTDNGATWTQMTASAEWVGRYASSSVAMPDGSIVLMGGQDSGGFKNDVWRSTDNGATWTQMTPSADWIGRSFYSSVVTPDGSIVLMGGGNQNGYLNDVWQSTDYGATWTQMTPSAIWKARNAFNSVTLPDGSIVLMGGYTPSVMNDVWRSMDNGATWMLVNANAGWLARGHSSSVAMPDGSIILMGGATNVPNNDVWRTTDDGATWAQLSNAEWTGRLAQCSAVMPDGSTVLMGGINGGIKNDVWRLMPAGSSAENPTHTYTSPGTYSVTLTVIGSEGSDTKTHTDYITVMEPLPGSLEVKSSPSHANIYINGVNTGKIAKWTFDDMTPGDYDVYVTLDGYTTPETEHVTVVAEQTTKLHFKLKKIE